MSDAFDSAFDQIVADVPKGTVRMQVLINATAAQIQAIPDGSDVAYASPRAFHSGLFDDEVRGEFTRCAEANDCGHLHGFLIYTPPVPAPDSTLTAETLAKHAVNRWEEAVRLAITHPEVSEWTLHDVLTMMAHALVHTAREGMVFPPF